MMENSSCFHLQAQVLRALANETRLKIVKRLEQGECSVGELTDLAGLDQSTVSKHLSVLRTNGIVASRKAGSTVYYRLLTPCVLNFLSCASKVLKQKRDQYRE